MMTFNEQNCFEVDGNLYEKATAFPSAVGDQKAIMLKWNGEKWEMSVWNAWIDLENGRVASGWETFRTDDLAQALFGIGHLMENIERDA